MTLSLQDVTSKIGSGATPRGGKSVYQDRGVAFIRSQNVLDLSVVDDGMVYIDEEAAYALRAVTVEPGDVLVNITGDSVARVAVWERTEEARVSQHVAIVRPDRTMANSRYLQYWLVAPAQKSALLTLSAAGGSRPALTKAMLQQFNFNNHDVAEQDAIAEVLGALDDKIAANRRASEAIDGLVRTVFAERFGSMPVTSLSTIADVNRIAVNPVSDGSLRYLDIASVGNGDHEIPPLTDWVDAPGRARRGVRPGDVVWSTVRPNRRSHSLVLDEDPLLVASTGLAVISPRQCGPAFLYEATRQPGFQAFLESVADGSAYPAVRAAEFTRAPIPDGAAHIRDAFEEMAGPMRKLQANLRLENTQLAATRDGLLPLLMSGKITVKDAEERVEQQA